MKDFARNAFSPSNLSKPRAEDKKALPAESRRPKINPPLTRREDMKEQPEAEKSGKPQMKKQIIHPQKSRKKLKMAATNVPQPKAD